MRGTLSITELKPILKIYNYKAEEVGLGAWPSGLLRLEGIEVTDPREADIFVCPGGLHIFTEPSSLDRFPYMKGNEARHVFYHCSDDEVKYGKPCRFIRCNTRPWNFGSDPNTIPWPWPVENYAECIEAPDGGFKYDVSFQGWMSSNARRYSIDSCQSTSLKCDIAAYPDFCGYIYDKPEGVRRRREFRRSMKESRVALCGESIPGVFPYRYFEAMSAARVPVLIGSEQVFPWADEIPYAEFSVFVPREMAGKTGDILVKFLQNTTDEQLINKGRLARQMWERYLDRDKWVGLMTEAVEKAMAVHA